MNAMGIPLGAAVAVALAVAAILAVLHVLRVRPRPVRVVTTLFWQQAIEEPKARTLWQRFRHPRTFALLAAIGAILSLALANPRLGGAKDAVSEVIVLDAGLSMGTRVDASRPTRLDDARDIVLAEAERLAASDNLAVVVADPAPRLLCGFDAPRPVLRSALADLQPATLPATRAEALNLAADLLHNRPAGRILLVTDRPAESRDALVGKLEVRTAFVGEPAANAAIVGAQYRPHFADPLRGEFLLRVGAWGSLPRDVEVRITRAGGAPLLSEVVHIEEVPVASAESGLAAPSPLGIAQVRIADLPADGDELLVQLGPADGLAADDRMSFRLPLRQTIRVAAPDDIAATLRLAILADPACRLVKPTDEHDILLVNADELSATTKPVLWVPPSGENLSPQGVAVDSATPLTGKLDFGSAKCGAAGALPELEGDATRLFFAGDFVLADWRMLEEISCIRLAPALVAEDSGVARMPAFPVFVARVLHELAGWTDAPLALDPADRPLWDRLSVWDRLSGRSRSTGFQPVSSKPMSATPLSLPGSRSASNTTLSDEVTAAPPLSDRRLGAPDGFEWLLAAAGLLLLIEAVLHTRGRIP